MPFAPQVQSLEFSPQHSKTRLRKESFTTEMVCIDKWICSSNTSQMGMQEWLEKYGWGRGSPLATSSSWLLEKGKSVSFQVCLLEVCVHSSGWPHTQNYMGLVGYLLFSLFVFKDWFILFFIYITHGPQFPLLPFLSGFSHLPSPLGPLLLCFPSKQTNKQKEQIFQGILTKHSITNYNQVR